MVFGEKELLWVLWVGLRVLLGTRLGSKSMEHVRDFHPFRIRVGPREREREGQHEFSIFQLYPQGHEDEGEVALNLVHHYFDKLLAFMHEISPL